MLLRPIPDGQRAVSLPPEEAGQTDVAHHEQADTSDEPIERARLLAAALASVLSVGPSVDTRGKHELMLASSLVMHVLELLEGLRRMSPPPVDAE